ncbi:tail fiber assembly protein [Prodigiosinella aquatilis]|nr:tail fiber assembly protein [Prodigiosinella sp. LS101]WJV55685.1 tail fiber assembly protein [Prodigiosinella sp. LS101]WJV60046.1 tail fiber assembly protein [Pectobacteriaceae bacterium C111]
MPYYSKSTGGFYAIAIHGNAMPSDVVEINADYYQQLLNEQSNGNVIQFNDTAEQPIAVQPPELSAAELAAVAVKTAKNELLNRRTIAADRIAELTYAIELNMATDEEKTALLAWKKYVVLLSRIDATTAPNIDWPVIPTL